MVELVVPRSLRPAVHEQQQRIFVARIETRRLHLPCLHGLSVPTAEGEARDLAELDVLEHLPVEVSQLRGWRALGSREIETKQLPGTRQGRVGEDQEPAVRCHIGLTASAARHERSELQAGELEPRDRDLAVIPEGHIEARAVWRPREGGDRAVGGLGQVATLPRRPIIDEEPSEVRLLHRAQRGAVGNVAPVRGVQWRAVGGLVGRDRLRRAAAHRHHEQVAVAGQ